MENTLLEIQFGNACVSKNKCKSNPWVERREKGLSRVLPENKSCFWNTTYWLGWVVEKKFAQISYWIETFGPAVCPFGSWGRRITEKEQSCNARRVPRRGGGVYFVLFGNSQIIP